ncbi:MAG: hypothetical protein JRG73_13355 [Deltaproteobacteria bacterium]|nr:hypothetical protein [Deltaproteobacteria bacterium]
MLSSEELSLIYRRAYVPEHLPGYVVAVSAAEPHLHGEYLCFTRGTHLIFIGYPLGMDVQDTPRFYKSACERFHPATVAIIAPQLWLPAQTYQSQPEDSYYRLELPLGPIDPEVAYMVRRAAREIRVTQGRFGKEHKRLVKDFLSRHELSREHRLIFERIPHYLKTSEAARLLEARKGDILVAFTIVDLGSANYAFYLFNFRSVEASVPGASDLLFQEMAELARSEGKAAINLGLGIHPGVRNFKEKWGGTPFLPHTHALVHRHSYELDALGKKIC